MFYARCTIVVVLILGTVAATLMGSFYDIVNIVLTVNIPFGAAVLNARQQEVGMVTDAGEAYLTGLKPGDTFTAHWAGREQCRMTIPNDLPADMATTLPLSCVKG